MKKFGLIGKSLGHSFSKAFFTSYFLENKIDASYENVEIESISTSFGAVNGSFGMTYQLDSAWLIRTNVATGFRAPNLAELTSNGVHHGALRYELGNVNLTTENNVELDLGTEFSREHVSIAISGFYNHINNFIYLSFLLTNLLVLLLASNQMIF